MSQDVSDVATVARSVLAISGCTMPITEDVSIWKSQTELMTFQYTCVGNTTRFWENRDQNLIQHLEQVALPLYSTHFETK